MEKPNLSHKIVCDCRKKLNLTGIEKVESTSENLISCKTMGTGLFVYGKKMHVVKLDVVQGIVEVEGEIDKIVYQQQKKPFLKRIFK